MTTQDVDAWYRFGSPDESTLLHRGAAHAKWGDRSLDGQAEVVWRWRRTPTAQASFSGPLGSHGYIDPMVRGPGLTFDGVPLRPAKAAEVDWASSPDDVRVDGVELRDERLGSFTAVTLVEVVGVNMHALGVGGETALDAGGWSVRIVEHPDDATAHLRTNGGYGATHRIRISRNDGSVFALDEYEEISNALWHFLGFVGSRLPGMALPVGFDAAGKAVWTDWRCSIVDTWAGSFGWFDRHMLGPELPGLFVAWWDRWHDELWGTVLQRATRMLMAANRSDPLEVAVMTGWAMLEMLAWAVLVVEQGWLMWKDFDRLASSSDVRLLLSWCSISTAVPTQLERLAGFAAGDSNLADAPGTVGWVRNRLTHPPSKLEKGWPRSSELVESWRLEMEWSELVMLRVLGYQGGYGNRCTVEGRWQGAVEPVPWAAAKPGG